MKFLSIIESIKKIFLKGKNKIVEHEYEEFDEAYMKGEDDVGDSDIKKSIDKKKKWLTIGAVGITIIIVIVIFTSIISTVIGKNKVKSNDDSVQVTPNNTNEYRVQYNLDEGKEVATSNSNPYSNSNSQTGTTTGTKDYASALLYGIGKSSPSSTAGSSKGTKTQGWEGKYYNNTIHIDRSYVLGYKEEKSKKGTKEQIELIKTIEVLAKYEKSLDTIVQGINKESENLQNKGKTEDYIKNIKKIRESLLGLIGEIKASKDFNQKDIQSILEAKCALLDNALISSIIIMEADLKTGTNIMHDTNYIKDNIIYYYGFIEKQINDLTEVCNKNNIETRIEKQVFYYKIKK